MSRRANRIGTGSPGNLKGGITCSGFVLFQGFLDAEYIKKIDQLRADHGKVRLRACSSGRRPRQGRIPFSLFPFISRCFNGFGHFCKGSVHRVNNRTSSSKHTVLKGLKSLTRIFRESSGPAMVTPLNDEMDPVAEGLHTSIDQYPGVFLDAAQGQLFDHFEKGGSPA